MKSNQRRAFSLALTIALCFLCLSGGPAIAELEAAYILTPPQLPDPPKTEHEFVNILFLGADYGVYTIGDGKEDISNCHTDSVIMVSYDKTARKVSLISIPRDTMTYVPGVYGVYKLNAAVNCAETFENGLRSTRDTVAWLLGGIRPDHYVLVTGPLVEQIGDAIGGLDIDVEMSYTDTNGIHYDRGLQHLDGVGIMEYARARRNATVNNNDYGRTSRQRTVLSALFHKISQNPDLIFDALDTIVENFGKYFFSDLTVFDLWDMLSLAEDAAAGSIESYEMSGELAMSMKYFNSSYFDEGKRHSILQEVYGLDMPPLRLNSHGYMNYLFLSGFGIAKAIRVSGRVIDWAREHGFSGPELTAAETARSNAIDALSAIDDRLEQAAVDKATKMDDVLRINTLALVDACHYPDTLSWKITDEDHWYMDPDVNQYYGIDWR